MDKSNELYRSDEKHVRDRLINADEGTVNRIRTILGAVAELVNEAIKSHEERRDDWLCSELRAQYLEHLLEPLPLDSAHEEINDEPA